MGATVMYDTIVYSLHFKQSCITVAPIGKLEPAISLITWFKYLYKNITMLFLCCLLSSLAHYPVSVTAHACKSRVGASQLINTK